jgi:hypothetical protein
MRLSIALGFSGFVKPVSRLEFDWSVERVGIIYPPISGAPQSGTKTVPTRSVVTRGVAGSRRVQFLWDFEA